MQLYSNTKLGFRLLISDNDITADDFKNHYDNFKPCLDDINSGNYKKNLTNKQIGELLNYFKNNPPKEFPSHSKFSYNEINNYDCVDLKKKENLLSNNSYDNVEYYDIFDERVKSFYEYIIWKLDDVLFNFLTDAEGIVFRFFYKIGDILFDFLSNAEYILLNYTFNDYLVSILNLIEATPPFFIYYSEIVFCFVLGIYSFYMGFVALGKAGWSLDIFTDNVLYDALEAFNYNLNVSYEEKGMVGVKEEIGRFYAYLSEELVTAFKEFRLSHEEFDEVCKDLEDLFKYVVTLCAKNGIKNGLLEGVELFYYYLSYKLYCFVQNGGEIMFLRFSIVMFVLLLFITADSSANPTSRAY